MRIKFRSNGFCVRVRVRMPFATINFPKMRQKIVRFSSLECTSHLMRILPHKTLQLFTLQFISKARVISFGIEIFIYCFFWSSPILTLPFLRFPLLMSAYVFLYFGMCVPPKQLQSLLLHSQ